MVCLFGCYVSCWECRDPTHKEVNRPTTGGSSCERNKTQPTASTSTQPQTHCGSVSEGSKLVDKIITIEPVSWPL